MFLFVQRIAKHRNVMYCVCNAYLEVYLVIQEIEA